MHWVVCTLNGRILNLQKLCDASCWTSSLSLPVPSEYSIVDTVNETFIEGKTDSLLNYFESLDRQPSTESETRTSLTVLRVGVDLLCPSSEVSEPTPQCQKLKRVEIDERRLFDVMIQRLSLQEEGSRRNGQEHFVATLRNDNELPLSWRACVVPLNELKQLNRLRIKNIDSSKNLYLSILAL